MREYEGHENEEALAAALKYDAKKDSAPQVVALGKGYVAQNMVQAAQENNIKVVKDSKLAPVLHKLSVGDEIPEQLYKAVAEILVFVSGLDNERKSKFGLEKTKG
jgi:flagellar biosynthesis protein